MVAFLAARCIGNARVLDAMAAVPRERFVPAELAAAAYRDGPAPIGEGQTISQPLIVAEMLAAAALQPGDRVLEVGAGSGYVAALLSRLGEVFAIERLPMLADAARERLAALGCANVQLRTADGTFGWPEAAPFDAIIVSAGGPRVPTAFKEQLAPGGRLMIPVGQPRMQRLQKLTRGETLVEEDLGLCAFVPLIGEDGWPR